MIQEAFRLEGKVAIVTGCDTGLGQGMAVALAEAGCDVVGVNRKIPHETSEKINALGRRFMAIQADLSHQDALTSIVTKTVSAFGLGRYSGQQCRNYTPSGCAGLQRKKIGMT